jgi:exosome complex RNA-binding protein Rrp4
MTEIDSIETSKFIDSVDNEFHLSLDGKLVLPGDKLSHLIKQTEKKKIILSNGLSLSNEIEVRKAGSLKFRSPSTFYVESLSQFYQPQIGDQVLSYQKNYNFASFHFNLIGYWNY